MEITLITTGIVCLIAAIVGGGLKGLGFEFPVLTSTRRQVIIGIFGLILVIVSQRDKIIEYICKNRIVSEQSVYRSEYPYFKSCAANTKNVIVSSGYTDRSEAIAKLSLLRSKFSEFRFKLFETVAKDGESNRQFAIVAGHGLNQTEAQALVKRIKNAGVAKDAYDILQSWDAECNDESGVEP